MTGNWKPFIATRQTEADKLAQKKPKIVWEAKVGHLDKEAAMEAAIQARDLVGSSRDFMACLQNAIGGATGKRYEVDENKMELVERTFAGLRS